ncbi:hypothetical protein Tco_1093669 [Tanacetum coccineum]|uniref:Uncharacterized protein n=1 Tax=Tanacetum coccineum TaxID=301880 RepID=A0ABQ5IDE4_9ASTR
MIPYLIFIKPIVTTFPKISRRAHDRYHNVADDVMIKIIFNLGKSKGVVGIKILNWMITDEMKLAENYRLYAEVFGVDVPTTQSQPIKSTQRTHTTTSAPKIPNLEIAEVLQDTLQVSLAEQKSHEELEATQNVEKVKEHLMAEEIKKLEPKSDKERLEVEKIANISQPVNVIGEEEESVEDDYEQRIILEREKSQSEVAKMIADAIQQERNNFRLEISLQVNYAITNHIPLQVDSSVKSYMLGHVLHVHPTQATPTNAQEQQHQLYLTMKDNPRLQQDDLPIWLALKYKFERLHMAAIPCIPSVIRTRD